MHDYISLLEYNPVKVKNIIPNCAFLFGERLRSEVEYITIIVISI